MDEIIASANKEVLVEMVKFAQKKGMCGSKGSWKAFVRVHHDELGENTRDPARRSIDSLVTFLRTFHKDDDLQFFKQVLQSYPNLDESMLLKKSNPDNETPEQVLVSVTRGHRKFQLEYSFPSNEEDWLIINCKKAKGKSFAMLSVDCEMVSCDDGTEALVRICVVDENLQVKLDEFVNPNKAIADYRTEVTGISAKDLDGVTCSLKDIQNSMKNFVSDGTILVGCSLNNALRVLKLGYNRVIDAAYIFSYAKSFAKIPLNLLCKTVLGYELRKKGTPRNCLDDALAAMKLVLARTKGGHDGIIPMGTKMDKAVLLLTRIPAIVPITNLLSIVPGAYTGEIRGNRRRRDTYSAFAIFKDEEEANEAFANIQGPLQKDSLGRPEKIVKFDLGFGIIDSLSVLKTYKDDASFHKLKTPKKGKSCVVKDPKKEKRRYEDEATDRVLKKPKKEERCEYDASIHVVKQSKKDISLAQLKKQNEFGNQCERHLKEIETLKHVLSKRDEEISNLKKTIIAISRKQVAS